MSSSCQSRAGEYVLAAWYLPRAPTALFSRCPSRSKVLSPSCRKRRTCGCSCSFKYKMDDPPSSLQLLRQHRRCGSLVQIPLVAHQTRGWSFGQLHDSLILLTHANSSSSKSQATVHKLSSKIHKSLDTVCNHRQTIKCGLLQLSNSWTTPRHKTTCTVTITKTPRQDDPWHHSCKHLARRQDSLIQKLLWNWEARPKTVKPAKNLR